MSVPTPVTNSTIVMLSGSARNATSTSSPPTWSHSKRRKVKWRSSSPSPRRPAKVTTPATNDAPTMTVASQPAHGSPSRRPARRRTRKPASGSAGTSQTALSTGSPAQEADVVGGRAGAPPEGGNGDTEAHDHLSRGHHEDEEHHHLTADVVEGPGEGHEGDV